MATTIVTPDTDAVVSEIHIAAPAERVFEALIDPKQLMTWWTGEKCRAKEFLIEPRRGGKWSYQSASGQPSANGGRTFSCAGEVIEYDPPRLLAYTWIADWHEDKSRRTVVRYELVAEDGGTRVKVTHSGLAQEPAARQDYSGGWPGVLLHLKTFVEK